MVLSTGVAHLIDHPLGCPNLSSVKRADEITSKTARALTIGPGRRRCTCDCSLSAAPDPLDRARRQATPPGCSTPPDWSVGYKIFLVIFAGVGFGICFGCFDVVVLSVKCFFVDVILAGTVVAAVVGRGSGGGVDAVIVLFVGGGTFVSVAYVCVALAETEPINCPLFSRETHWERGCSGTLLSSAVLVACKKRGGVWPRQKRIWSVPGTAKQSSILS